MSVFIVVASAVFFLLFLIWSKNDWVNFLIKAGFFFLSAWGAKLVW